MRGDSRFSTHINTVDGGENMKTKCYALFLLLIVFGVMTTKLAQSADTMSLGQRVNRLEADLAAAKSTHVDVLSPNFFNAAESALMKAKRGLARGAKISAISQFVAEGNARLKKAEEIAKISRTILRDTNEARDNALGVGADKLGEPYDKVEKDYLNLTKAIERDNLSFAQKSAAKVQAAFQEVKIMAIKNQALGNARQMLDSAKKANAQRGAPKVYSEALQALNDAGAYIDQNPYASETIRQKAAHTEFMVQRMIAVSESSKKFKEMTPEASAIYLESLLMHLGTAVDAGDLRHQGVETQVDSLTGAIATIARKRHFLEKDNQDYQAQIADLEEQLSGLKGYSREQEAAKQKLAAEREFNEQFNTVQRYFKPDEAEVYKQSKQLVIRMRGIQFPVGQAILTPDNFTLLSKVQRAIQTFGQPIVTIEGHTDSTGSAKVNKALSQKRAEAVKSYLVANQTLPEDRILATGYGPDRPLAPNTTPEGRAINRRIDVLIKPVDTK
jgi:outer membrane protein OmpA-like peptidoglycan-associated protein